MKIELKNCFVEEKENGSLLIVSKAKFKRYPEIPKYEITITECSEICYDGTMIILNGVRTDFN